MEKNTKTAYFAGGCFWGLEHLFTHKEGVVDVTTGFMGGRIPNPTYEQVYRDDTGHAETIRVEYDPGRINYEQLARLFFEVHDPTQRDGQGPDIGTRYRSEIFYTSDEERRTAEQLIEILRGKGYDVVTRLTPAGTFYTAEQRHQHHYDLNGEQPYCHIYTKRF